MIGRIKGPAFRLRRRIPYQSSFQTYLTGTFRAQEGGTAIEGELGMHRFVLAFGRFWLRSVLAFGVVFLLVAILSGGSSLRGGGWTGLVMPAGMFLFGRWMFGYGRQLARDEGPFLTRFLCEVLKARERITPI